ncbi:hypothetical protein QJU93_07125 [Pasteurella skyensis]|uniref:Uncharacterized protein n=1 Tax=Phocoenobacter skyensis TaxID=97481 RepID=A0AAJ6NAD5_9PAST|nr:hypothetical protein [Pasteurella skyensis]MDP8173127.1 hypothetical protein [Pasteurella skyensis]MDP8178940.1 hypothetical protein [Pasteurella skyensis]
MLVFILFMISLVIVIAWAISGITIFGIFALAGSFYLPALLFVALFYMLFIGISLSLIEISAWFIIPIFMFLVAWEYIRRQRKVIS